MAKHGSGNKFHGNKSSGSNKGKRFVNPYNFVPLGMEGKTYFDNSTGHLTGVIHYTINPQSPIFIPNTSNDRAFGGDPRVKEHRQYDFYSYRNLEGITVQPEERIEPVLPGSEIRGGIRSAYEALTNSCMSVLEEEILSKRERTPAEPGLLIREKDGSFKLRPATQYKIHTRGYNALFNLEIRKKESGIRKSIRWNGNTFDNFQKVHIKESASQVTDILEHPGEKTKEGILFIGEPIRMKHNDSVFVAKEGEGISVDTATVEAFKTSLREFYQNTKINKHLGSVTNNESKNSDTHFGYADLKVGDITPVWHMLVNGKIYLSSAQMGRYVYTTTMKSLAHHHVQCDDPKKLCKACALFGTVSDNGSGKVAFGRASKIRFTDALAKGTFQMDSLKHLKELSSPKISSLEFYTKANNNSAIRTYEYYRKNKNAPLVPFLKGELKMRGRKFYWHDTREAQYHTNQVTERNISVRALLPTKDASFSGKVFFEKLTQHQLKELLFTLTMGSNHKDGCHKIGHGKPIGLGSVKIEVDSVQIRTIESQPDLSTVVFKETNCTEEYSYYFQEATKPYYGLVEWKDKVHFVQMLAASQEVAPLRFQFDVLFALLRMTNRRELEGETIQYPMGNPKEEEIFKWFAKNIVGTSYKQTLPDPVAKADVALRQQQ